MAIDFFCEFIQGLSKVILNWVLFLPCGMLFLYLCFFFDSPTWLFYRGDTVLQHHSLSLSGLTTDGSIKSTGAEETTPLCAFTRGDRRASERDLMFELNELSVCYFIKPFLCKGKKHANANKTNIFYQDCIISPLHPHHYALGATAVTLWDGHSKFLTYLHRLFLVAGPWQQPPLILELISSCLR